MRQFLNIILNIINKENVIIALGQSKIPVSILSDKFCEEQVFPYLLPTGRFGYNASRYIPKSTSPYFNQILPNFNQHFESNADYTFSARSAYEQYHLHSSINVSMRKIRLDTLTTGVVKNNLKTIEKSVASGNAFYLCAQSKENKHAGNSFYMMYQLWSSN